MGIYCDSNSKNTACTSKIPVINFSDISKSICKAIIKVTEIREHGKIKLKIV